MNDNDSDIGELNEDDVEDLNDDELLEEVVFSNDLTDGESYEENSDEENDRPSQFAAESSPARDDSEFVFKKHTGPVFCCALDPKNGNLAVTGGEDDRAFVWEIHNGQVVLDCWGHTDSITMAAFSFDGSYVATGDMSGVLQVWKVNARTLVWKETVGDLNWMQWHHGTNALLCAITSGELFMWRIPSGECKVIPGHGVSSDCGVILPDGRRALVGYSDGVVKVFELKSGTLLGSTSAGDVHQTAVSCADTYTDNSIVATGGGSGRVVLFKTQPNLKVLWSFDCSQPESDSAFVEAVSFSKDPSLPVLAAGTLSGKLFILDFVKQVVRHKCEQPAGISRLLWDRQSAVLFAGCLDGIVRLYDARCGTTQAQLLGHTDNILDICLSMDGNTLLSASDDSTCRVFAVSPPER